MASRTQYTRKRKLSTTIFTEDPSLGNASRRALVRSVKVIGVSEGGGLPGLPASQKNTPREG